MLKIENAEVVGWEHAIRGCRNPYNSWEKSDSGYGDGDPDVVNGYAFELGPNDHDLMMRLRNAGTDHRQFMRMITVYVDITAPLYWWKEMDQYRVGQTTNSCSTMHKIADKKFTLEDFSHEHLFNASDVDIYSMNALDMTIDALNAARKKYIETKVKDYWWQMIQILPSSYNQRRTVMLNYEVLANIYKSRKGHRLDEWKIMLDWIESLPYSELIAGKEK